MCEKGRFVNLILRKEKRNERKRNKIPLTYSSQSPFASIDQRCLHVSVCKQSNILIQHLVTPLEVCYIPGVSIFTSVKGVSPCPLRFVFSSMEGISSGPLRFI